MACPFCTMPGGKHDEPCPYGTEDPLSPAEQGARDADASFAKVRDALLAGFAAIKSSRQEPQHFE